MKTRISTAGAALVFLLAWCALAATLPAANGSAPLPLVTDGASPYTIYCPADAPRSVVKAAEELRHYIQRATGAQLPLSRRPRAPMIALGASAVSQAANLDVDRLPWEGFRIVTAGDDIFIAGRDTADGQYTPQGGTSNGTRNGAYVFLEKFLGVRWLVPGPQGDYVPKTASLAIPPTDFTDAPFFLNRRVPYIQERREEVVEWAARQRLGWSLYLNHSHNWESIPASAFDEHPDWFAQRGGRRVPPVGRYKLCVTNPELVRAFAAAAIKHFDERPDSTCYSLSPADSSGWCECPQCSALYEQGPDGRRSVTPAIVTFYNNVAKIVAEKYPHKTLAGYVYAEYVYPPKQAIPLASNVFLVWAPSFDYGYTLFRPEVRRLWDELVPQWTAVTRQIAYYDLPIHISTESGALNPPGLKILKFLYPRLKSAGMKGVYVYGVGSWGRGGPLNYLLARLAWDPAADVDALFDEYCQKAYGEGGTAIAEMLRMMDAEVERHYREFSETRYNLTPDMMRDVYAKTFPAVERLYRSAEAAVAGADAKARLEMIGDNLTVTHWNLRQFGHLDRPEQSTFYLSDKDFFAFLTRRQNTIGLAAGPANKTPSYVNEALTVSVEPISSPAAATPFLLRGDQHLVLVPASGRPIAVRFGSISSRGSLITYTVHDAQGRQLSSGLVSKEVPIEIRPDGSPYYHLSLSADTASFVVEVNGALWAADSSLDDEGLHFLNKTTPLAFYVPEGTGSFELALAASAPGEPALATLRSPSGKTTEFDCSQSPVDRQLVHIERGEHGWWTMTVRKTPQREIDDVWVKLGQPLAGFISLAGQDRGVVVRRAAGKPVRKPGRVVRLLTVGNSFSQNATRYLDELAQAAGHALVIHRTDIGGGSLEQHWQKAMRHEDDPQDPDGLYASGRSLKEELQAEPWDYITIQQASIKSHDLATYRPYAKLLAGYIRERAPQARLLVHQTWAYRSDDPRFDAPAEPGEPPTQEAMYRGLKNAYETVAAELRAPLLPVGNAFHRADNDPLWGYRRDDRFDPRTAQPGQLPDQTHSLHVGWRWTKTDGKPRLGMDGHHANVAGEYLGSCVFFEVLYGESAVDNPYVPEGVDADYARFLRQTAHQAVAEQSRPKRAVQRK